MIELLLRVVAGIKHLLPVIQQMAAMGKQINMELVVEKVPERELEEVNPRKINHT